jgi:hypothetical protein
LLRRLRNACSFPAALLLLNLYFCQDLFGLEYSVWMGSIEAAFISISRYMLDNWRDLTWFPLWYGGIPFQNAYPPLLHALVAVAAGLSGASPARAHHAVTAAFYALGPLTAYWLALRLSRSRWPSFWAALAYSIFSPSIFLVPAIRSGMGGYFELRRFFALVPYGEGPHIASLALLPLAILALDIALERRRPVYYVLAALAMDAVALSNWIGTFALALALLAYLAGCRWGAPREWVKAAAIGALAYALACTWIPPSTIATIRYNAQFVGDFRGVYGRLPLYAALGLGVTLALGWLLARWNISRALRFFVLFALPVSVVTLGYEWFGAAIVPQPNRYHLEMDLALCAAAAFLLYSSTARLKTKTRAALAVAALLLCIVPIRLDRRRARRIVKPIDIAETIEYRSAQWFAAHMPGERVFVPGTISYWLNAFADNPQLGGGFDQGIVNRELRAVQYQIYSGDGARSAAEGGAVSGLWLRAYGVSAVEVGDANSREQYRPFRAPERFEHFSAAFQEGGDAIRLIPGTAALAFVIPEGAVVRRPPENGADVAGVRRYVAALDAGAARFAWTSRHSASIHMTGRPDQRLSVEIAYHPGWRATVDGGARQIERDGLGQMVMQPQCQGACVVLLNYDGGLEMGLARAVSWTSIAACLLWIGVVPFVRGGSSSGASSAAPGRA